MRLHPPCLLSLVLSAAFFVALESDASVVIYHNNVRSGQFALQSFHASSLQTYPWHNSLNALDVDASGDVAPVDALIVINKLNADAGLLQALAQLDAPAPQFYYDTSADNLVSPLDALLVINRLNAVAVPEPSSVALLAVGGAAGIGWWWRRRRAAC